MTHNEQERAEFEAWLYLDQTKYDPERMSKQEIEIANLAYQAGRAALQSQPMPPEISRGLLCKIVDEVFDGAIKDASVIEDIYRVVARECALQSQDREDEDLKGALLLALEYWADRQQRYKNRSPVWVQKARAALGIDHARRVKGEL